MRKISLFCWLGVCAGLQLLSSVTAYSRDGHPYHITKAGPVKGLVTSADGKPLQGVTVTVKGSNKAAVTDAAGHFSIDANNGDVLVFSFVGYTPQQIKAGAGDISVALVASSTELSTVVVTALGIKKQARALGYSTTEVDGSKLTEARESNIGNALTGQVAGVSVAGVATGPSGSSRVVIRGNSSISQNDQPLYMSSTACLTTIPTRVMQANTEVSTRATVFPTSIPMISKASRC